MTSRKKCFQCRKKINEIDFRDTNTLFHFQSSWTKIKPGSDSGTCAKHQRSISNSIKRARYMGLMSYVNK